VHALQLQLEARASDTHTVVITSASPGDGKTTIALALAHTLAAADRPVVLLDFDLRKGDLGQRLRLRSDPQALLRDDGGIEQALVPVDGLPNLRVLAVPPASNTETIIQGYSRRLPEIVERARPYGHFILIDTPPIGQVADALLLATRADDVLLVARPGHTDRRDLAVVRQSLQQLAIAPTGLIVVGPTRRVRRYHDFADGDPHVALDPSSAHPAGAAAEPDHKHPAGTVATLVATVRRSPPPVAKRALQHREVHAAQRRPDGCCIAIASAIETRTCHGRAATPSRTRKS
jgi:Mrp family chromosome partitioning ATPase